MVENSMVTNMWAIETMRSHSGYGLNIDQSSSAGAAYLTKLPSVNLIAAGRWSIPLVARVATIGAF